MKENSFDIIVVGGGASGLMAAISAARIGVRVAILDHHAISGKKLLATGNGKCNFTNQMQGSSCYRCNDPVFVLQVLNQFSVKETLHFFENLGMLSKARQGYYYPRSGQASAVRNALLAEIKRLNVEIYNEIGIRNILRQKDRFLLQTKSGDFTARTCILAAGGKASPKTGSDGSGYIYAEKLGHTIHKPLPALVPLVSDSLWLKETAGVRCDARVTLLVNGNVAAADTGEVQLTDYGISGIPVFQVSRYASVALENKCSVTAVLDFLPELSEGEIRRILIAGLSFSSVEKNWEELLSGFVNQKISAMVCQKLKFPQMTVTLQPQKVWNRQLEQAIRALKGTSVSIVKTKNFDQAQVTCGGISVEEICPDDLQSKLVPGLFFAGEIIDVDGICGGYNLQWAWSSGYVAGVHAAALSDPDKR